MPKVLFQSGVTREALAFRFTRRTWRVFSPVMRGVPLRLKTQKFQGSSTSVPETTRSAGSASGPPLSTNSTSCPKPLSLAKRSSPMPIVCAIPSSVSRSVSVDRAVWRSWSS